MSQIEGWPKNHLSFLNFPPDFKSKQILIGQKQFFQCLHWLTAIQNKQKGGKFELDKSHLGHPSIRLNNIALVRFQWHNCFHFPWNIDYFRQMPIWEISPWERLSDSVWNSSEVNKFRQKSNRRIWLAITKRSTFAKISFKIHLCKDMQAYVKG